METIQDYTVYCTEEQTIRAYKLGAPLIKSSYYNDVISCKAIDTNEQYYPIIPTTQQMIGWLREQGLYLEISYDFSGYGMRLYSKSGRVWSCNYQPIYEQAELAAIDAALDYLEKGGNQ